MNKKNFLTIFLIAVCVIAPASAFAVDGNDPNHYILGINHIWVALGITVIGIAFRTFIGMAGKSRKEFNFGLVGTSFIIGFFASVQLVIASLQHIPADVNDLTLLSIITGEIATVMGIDAGVKSASKRAYVIKDKFVKKPTEAKPGEIKIE